MGISTGGFSNATHHHHDVPSQTRSVPDSCHTLLTCQCRGYIAIAAHFQQSNMRQLTTWMLQPAHATGGWGGGLHGLKRSERSKKAVKGPKR